MKILSCFMEPLLIEALENQKQYFDLLRILSEDNEVFFSYLSNEQKEYFDKNHIEYDKIYDGKGFDVLFIFGGRMKSSKEIDDEIENKEGIYYSLKKLINEKKNFVVANYLYDPKITKISETKSFIKNNITYVYFNAYNFNDEHSLNIFEYFCFNKMNKCKKEYNFCFGYTASETTERKYLSDYVNKNIKENENILVFCKDKFTKRNNLINQKEYFDKIKKSKFSLIAPSNDKTAFSFSRLLECLSNNCIPFILNDCNLLIIKNNYEELYNFFVDNDLVISYETNINQKIELMNYDYLIKKINELNTIKMFKKNDEMKKKIKKLFSERIKEYV